MSYKIREIVNSAYIPSSKKHVLKALLDFIDNEGVCWPSFKRLSNNCSMSRRNVIRNINYLIDEGYIRKLSSDEAPVKRRSNIYKVLYEDIDIKNKECR